MNIKYILLLFNNIVMLEGKDRAEEDSKQLTCSSPTPASPELIQIRLGVLVQYSKCRT